MELHFFPFSHFSDRRRITSGIHRTSVDHFDEDEENQKDISDGEFILALLRCSCSLSFKTSLQNK